MKTFTTAGHAPIRIAASAVNTACLPMGRAETMLASGPKPANRVGTHVSEFRFA
jgi:hypothetical protein